MKRNEKIHNVANVFDTNLGKKIDVDYICNDEYDFTIGFECGARWADKNPKDSLVEIDKVIDWIKNVFINIGGDGINDYIIEDFINAMKK